MTRLPTPRDQSCRVASHQGSGEGWHQDTSILRGQLGLLRLSLPGPGNIGVPGTGLAAQSSHRHPGLTPVPNGSAPHMPLTRCAVLLGQVGDGSGPAPSLPTSTKPRPQRQDSGEKHTADVQELDVLWETRKTPRPRQGSESRVGRLGAGHLGFHSWKPARAGAAHHCAASRVLLLEASLGLYSWFQAQHAPAV